MRFLFIPILAGLVCITEAFGAPEQVGGTAGTVTGVVTDPSGALVPGASVALENPITGYDRKTTTDAAGAFRILNVPPNTYRLSVSASGFETSTQGVPVRSSVPISLNIPLALAGAQTTVDVKGGGAGMVEDVPYAHSDVDRSLYSKMPVSTSAAGLSDAITLASPGVVADSNGFFHPLGDHAQTSFSIDGQPVNDQQSKMFSTEVPLNAIQSMELITGAPGVQYGDKTSLVVNATTRSGLGQKPNGSFTANYGSFGAVGEDAAFAMGSAKLGNFLAANSLRTGRFLDTPEFYPMHDVGNSATIFDRFDWQAGQNDMLHINLMGARNWFQVPNAYDQPNQDQRQRVLSYNLAPGWQHSFGPTLLLTVNTFLRRDQVNYYPSRDLFHDTPVSVGEGRTLTNYGTRTELGYVHGIHNIRVGTQIMRTRLSEGFQLGITDPNFYDPAEQPGLVPFDLTRGGSLFQFAGRANIDEYAVYAQDTLTLHGLTLTPGLRFDQYNGLTSDHAVEPRIGASYLFKPTGTVLRAAYSRTFETPYNENLILSSATGAGGLATNIFGAYGDTAVRPGRRNQYNAGLQQALGKFFVVDADYFWKFTDNAFDFDTLLNTPLVFPISWRKSKVDGVAVRVSTTDIHGFQAYTTMGHTRARYFPPETGGVIFNSPIDSSVFRIDHDEAFEQTTELTYRRPGNGPWVAFTWRYDSGLVAGAVTSLSDALALTADQQAAMGFYCGAQVATLGNPITSCTSPNFGATRLVIPAPGTADADHNPPRVAPRHLFDVGFGTDNLLHTEPVRTTLKFSITNITNTVALYNFLSTFSGTHFVAPRSFQVALGVVF